MVVAALIGWWRFAPPHETAPPTHAIVFPIWPQVAAVSFGVFLLLLIGLPLLDQVVGTPASALASGFYWAGTFVFDGGPGALPLLQATVVAPGWVSNETFVTGFAAAEAMPGPFLTFSAFLGAMMPGALAGWPGGLFALGATFLPSSLIVLGALPFCDRLHGWTGAPGALQGVNAAVVGILLAALYRPIWSNAIQSPRDLGIGLVALLLLTVMRCPPALVVLLTAVITAALGSGASFL